LCGAFNSNIHKQLDALIRRYDRQKCTIEVYPIGKKVEEYVRKLALPVEIKGSYTELMENPAFEGAKQIAEQLIRDFLNHHIDRVELVYNHFRSTAIQIPTVEQYLPIVLSVDPAKVSASVLTDYIIEPDKATMLNSLIPQSLHNKIYAILLDSAAAEQAARTVAMQIATDNAGEILDDLTIQYNKQRQQAITNELLDIVGGSEALK
jgi:F-type H+-transporting ATPase subunit gamma